LGHKGKEQIQHGRVAHIKEVPAANVAGRAIHLPTAAQPAGLLLGLKDDEGVLATAQEPMGKSKA
jgi:light-regulated signal transduction histidine kinase (bacteriophytochrome)